MRALKDQVQSNRADGRKPRRKSTPKRELLKILATELPAEVFLPHEANAILFGRVETFRRVTASVKLRLRIGQTGIWALPPIQQRRTAAPKRPVATLSRLNRSGVFPPSVPPHLECDDVCLSKILDSISQQRLFGDVPPHHFLDLLATASGLPSTICAQLLLIDGIVERPFDSVEIAAVDAARSFWSLYAAGRAVHSAMVAGGQLEPWNGDLAFFALSGLEALLPGVVLPDHCRRCEFITNYVTESTGACLDVYSASGLPLVRHPFLSAFNPLFFGRPHLQQQQCKQNT